MKNLSHHGFHRASTSHIMTVLEDFAKGIPRQTLLSIVDTDVTKVDWLYVVDAICEEEGN